jgi:hypothetical protein
MNVRNDVGISLLQIRISDYGKQMINGATYRQKEPELRENGKCAPLEGRCFSNAAY